jgi:hypoxanthine phosphoribosyltransferase
MDVLIASDRIAVRVEELAVEIARTYAGRKLTVVGILTGSLLFLADLVRRLDLPIQIGLLKASSYRGTTTTAGGLEIDDALLPDVTDRHVLLLDDILDTGQTISQVVGHVRAKGAASVRSCVLLRKIGRQTVPFDPDFTGFEIPDKFVIGYGLDFDNEFRNLPFIGVLPEHLHP